MINLSLFNNNQNSPVVTKIETLYRLACAEYENISAANSVLSWWIANDGVSIYENGMVNDLLTAFSLSVNDVIDAGRLTRYAYIYDYVNNRLYQITASFIYGSIPSVSSAEIVIPALEIGFAGNTTASQYFKLYATSITGEDTRIHILDSRAYSPKGWWSIDDLVNSGGAQATTYLFISEMAKLLNQGCSFDQFASVANSFAQSIPELATMIRQCLTTFALSGTHGVVDYLSQYFKSITGITTSTSGIIVPDEDAFSVKILNPFSTISSVILVAADIVSLAISFVSPFWGGAISLLTTAIKFGVGMVDDNTKASVNTESAFNTMGAPVRLPSNVITNDMYTKMLPILTDYGIADLISPYGMIRVYAPHHPNVDKSSLIIDVMISVNYALSDITWYTTTSSNLSESRGKVNEWPVTLGSRNAELSDVVSHSKLEDMYEASAISLISLCLTGLSQSNAGNDIYVPQTSPLYDVDLSRLAVIGRSWAETQSLLSDFIKTYCNIPDLVRVGVRDNVTNDTLFVHIYRYFLFTSPFEGWIPGTVAYQPYVLAPNYDRSSVIATIVFGTALVAAATALTFATTKKVINALTRAQLNAQGRLYNATTAAYYDPSDENLSSYRSAKRTAKWLNVLAGYQVSSNLIAMDNDKAELREIESSINSIRGLITG